MIIIAIIMEQEINFILLLSCLIFSIKFIANKDYAINIINKVLFHVSLLKVAQDFSAILQEVQ